MSGKVRKTYEDDFKQEVLDAVKALGNVSKVSKKYSLPRSTIYDWLKVRTEREVKAQDYNMMSEMNILKMLVGEKELELRILKNKLK